jgi:hypothetical protein
MAGSKAKSEYTKAEKQQRLEAALRAALTTPPKPRSEMKLGKPRASRGKNLGVAKPKSQGKRRG